MENVWDYLRTNQLQHDRVADLQRHPRCLLQRREQPDEERRTHRPGHNQDLGIGQNLGRLV